METVLQDVRYAWRILCRSPGFTIVAILSLALGIGATTAIFSVVDAVILKPLPYEKPEQLVQLWMRFTGIGIPNDQNWVSAPEFVDLQQNQSLSQICAIDENSYNVIFGGSPERIESAGFRRVFSRCWACRPTWAGPFCRRKGTPATNG